mmetsp:Transcript_7269/g.26348  ORF Transcript_7269/g.26348 Transcript_7269/m.26348 type:complete len:435 (+) Transcript_7269:289-1593(+)
MDSQDLVGLLVGKELDDPVGLVHGPRPRVGHHAELSGLVLDALALELHLRLTNPRDLGVGVHDAWDGVVVHVADLAGDVLHARDAVLLGLVREHGARDDVTNGVDGGNVGLELVVDQNTAAVHLDPEVLEAETLGEGPPADRHEDDVSLHVLLLSALRGLHGELNPVRVGHRAGDLGLEPDLDSLLLHDALEVPADLVVHRRHDIRQELDDLDLGPEPRPHGPELQPDDAAADDDHLLGDLLECNGAGGRHDPLLVDLDAWERGDLASRRQHDVLGDYLLLASLGGCHRNLVRPGDLAPPLDILDLVLLEQALDSLGQAAHGLLLLGHHLANINRNVVHLDPIVRKVLGSILVLVATVQQSLARDAPHVEAGSTQGAPSFHADGLQAQLGGLDCGDISSRATSNHTNVVFRFTSSRGKLAKNLSMIRDPRRGSS